MGRNSKKDAKRFPSRQLPIPHLRKMRSRGETEDMTKSRKEYHKQYRDKNREKNREYQKLLRINNPELRRRYHETYQSKLTVGQKRQRARKNYEQQKSKDPERYRINQNRRSREWEKRNPEKRAAQRRNNARMHRILKTERHCKILAKCSLKNSLGHNLKFSPALVRFKMQLMSAKRLVKKLKKETK